MFICVYMCIQPITHVQAYSCTVYCIWLQCIYIIYNVSIGLHVVTSTINIHSTSCDKHADKCANHRGPTALLKNEGI